MPSSTAAFQTVKEKMGTKKKTKHNQIITILNKVSSSLKINKHMFMYIISKQNKLRVETMKSGRL